MIKIIRTCKRVPIRVTNSSKGSARDVKKLAVYGHHIAEKNIDDKHNDKGKEGEEKLDDHQAFQE